MSWHAPSVAPRQLPHPSRTVERDNRPERLPPSPQQRWGGGGVQRTEGAAPLRLLSTLLFLAAFLLLANALWIPVKAQVAQVLLQRAFTQSLVTGENVKPWSWADTWPIAEIRVPRLGASDIVLAGGTGEALAFGPTHLPGTPQPGARGTSVFSAHRDTHFAFLADIVVGDEVIIQRVDGLTFRYRITDSYVAKWNASGIDRHAPGFNLVLSTCWPLDAITQGDDRLIVTGVLVR